MSERLLEAPSSQYICYVIYLSGRLSWTTSYFSTNTILIEKESDLMEKLGVSIPDYSPKKIDRTLESINESFSANKYGLSIVLNTPDEYEKIIADLKKWGYIFGNEHDYSFDNELEDYMCYPFGLVVQYDNMNKFYIEMLDFYDFEEGIFNDFNHYDNINEFYKDEEEGREPFS